tara:strand:+ start:11 stop:214 length:204 start_codon:yes stop_codon:yes gene_type:complete
MATKRRRSKTCGGGKRGAAGKKKTAKKGAAKKTNPWLVHLKKVRARPENKGLGLKEVMKIAKKDYKK